MTISTPQNSDTYTTIQTPSTGEYREKGSRFLAFSYPVNDENEIASILEKVGNMYHDARHICYAWCIGPDRKLSRVNDDGEPSGTAGRPVMGQIHSFGLTNILVVVVRYFGGILLGAGGLTTAYKTAAREALQHATLVEKTIDRFFTISFPYELTKDVQRMLKNGPWHIYKEDYTDTCIYSMAVPKNSADILIHRFDQFKEINIKEIDKAI